MTRRYLPSPTPGTFGARKLMGKLLSRGRPAWLLGILGVFALGMVLAAALLWLPAADPALAQDGAGPEITADPLITSNPESGDAYDKGEAIQVAVTFNEPVTVTGKPRLRLTVGEKRRWAKYDRSEEDGARLIFTYKVKAADQDDDGVSIKKNSIDLNGGAIEDADGNRARLRHGKVTHQAGHKVNGSPPESEPEPTPTPQPEPTPTPTPEPTPTPQPTPTPTPTPEPTPTPQLRRHLRRPGTNTHAATRNQHPRRNLATLRRRRNQHPRRNRNQTPRRNRSRHLRDAGPNTHAATGAVTTPTREPTPSRRRSQHPRRHPRRRRSQHPRRNRRRPTRRPPTASRSSPLRPPSAAWPRTAPPAQASATR